MTMTVEKAFEEISFYKEGRFPTEAVEYISANRDLFEDKLLEVIDTYSTNAELYKLEKDDYISALCILAQFQSTKAFPITIKFLKNLPHAEGEDPLGDLLTETIPSILAACYDGDLGQTLELVYCEDSGLFSKVAVLNMLEILIYADRLTEDEVLSYYDLLMEKLHNAPEHAEFFQYALGCLGGISLEKLDNTCSKYNITLDEETQLEVDYLRREYTKNPYYLSNKDRNLNNYRDIIEGGMKTLENWQIFQPKEKKPPIKSRDDFSEWNSAQDFLPKMYEVGRNDPCYCGSGKKFKKCCL